MSVTAQLVNNIIASRLDTIPLDVHHEGKRALLWRPHVSLGKDAPDGRPIDRFGDIVAHAILGGLHHRYARI